MFMCTCWGCRKREVNLKVLKVPETEQKVKTFIIGLILKVFCAFILEISRNFSMDMCIYVELLG